MTTDNLIPRAIETASAGGRNAPTAETVGEFCEALGISRSFAYRLAKRGDLRFVKLGARTLVPLSERARVLASLPLSNPAPAERPQ